ncbi:MAG: Negative regulator of genetic competence ClpC/MecB [Actinobacteria bacterium ADurb.Bin444]|nr:MAG: Negative regulator of genetic competence ClpC/MecB [Actinobacteria bacterium ADurb.Bin444]
MVSRATGIPVAKLMQGERDKLLQMEGKLHERVVGQNEAIAAVANAIRRSRSGLSDPNRPTGSFLFLGPTGVGKTELTKALARFMFGSEESLIQLDMSEFMERHTVSRLVGAPPGYVGYEEAGQLTEAIRRRPYSIVVFDEIEKAHPEAHNMLLQIMEEGHLSDAKGHKVDFRNAILIMTSNIGADMIKRQSSLGFSLAVDEEREEKQAYEEMRKKLLESLKRVFRPEFINRLDGVIVFRSLNRDHIHQIVSLELDKVAERLKENEIMLTATPAAMEKLADEGFDGEMGARPLRRVIQFQVEDKLSDSVLAKEFRNGDEVLIDVDPESGEIVLRRVEPDKVEEAQPEALTE